MARKKKQETDQERPFLDMAGAPPNVLEEQKEADRMDAQAKHLSRGMTEASDTLKVMAKSASHGLATDSRDIQEACLHELATLAEHITFEARKAIREAASENRNLQG